MQHINISPSCTYPMYIRVGHRPGVESPRDTPGASQVRPHTTPLGQGTLTTSRCRHNKTTNITHTTLFCEPLVNTLLAAIERRFAATFEDEECLLATAFHPKFRLHWMACFEELMVNRSHVQIMMERKVEEFLRRADLETDRSSSSDDTEARDYYAGMVDKHYATGGRHRSTKSKAAQIVNIWLQANGTDSLAEAAFHSEKVLIDLFLRYNTAMPSSAAVDIIRAKRSSLSDENFNMLMFTKGNMLQNLV